jgi:nucleoside-diphosphate-sugar epimerase
MLNAKRLWRTIPQPNPESHYAVGLADRRSYRIYARPCEKKVGSRSTIAFKPLPADDPLQRQPDIGLAMRQLGWSPVVPFDEGLKATIDYFDQLSRGG